MIYVLLYNDYEVLCDSNLISTYDSVQCLSLLRNSDAHFEIQVIFHFSKKDYLLPAVHEKQKLACHNNVSASTSVNSMLHLMFEVMVGGLSSVAMLCGTCL
jgi:hypothetical protein